MNVRTFLTPEGRAMVRERLLKARQIVEKRWQPGKNSARHPCLLDAIQQAGAGMDPACRVRVFHAALRALSEALGAEWHMKLDGTWEAAARVLNEWNDLPDQTADAIAEKLGEVAEQFAPAKS